MNRNFLRRRIAARRNPETVDLLEGIPDWHSLRTLREPAVRMMAARLGIVYTGRMATLANINRAR